MIILTLLISSLFASFPEYFGANSLSGSIGGQPHTVCDPANNYYNASLLSNCQKSSFGYDFAYVDPNFNRADNIVVKNSSMSSDSSLPQYGNANNKYDSSINHTFHLLLPIRKFGVNSSFSLFTPLNKLLTQDTGDPFLPEYVLFRSRYKRSEIYFNLSKNLTSHLAMSIGTHIGFNASSNLNAQASLNGTAYGSSGSAKTEVKPLAGILFSTSYQEEQNSFYFTYQQEIKSELLAITTGETSVTPLPFHVTVTSMLYYDPHILRVGHSYRHDHFSLYSQLEYQIWSGYKTPRIFIHKESGVVQSSDDQERVETQNIFVPKIGLVVNLPKDFEWALGALYRPTPLTHSLSNYGNSVSSDLYALTTGLSNSFLIDGDPLLLALSFQYHWLKEKSVVKNSSTDLGGPEYKVGGDIYLLTMGLNFNF